ncbi:glycosyltransferase family 4 protein [Streptococcus mutans]|jgi:1,2-diacylglycerol 3-alpha-glucosyltransferase|uniref:Hexosyltransferase n=1 Tax=Streptococcus mutans serotype c (strain ATCC 700610 / UA159) TaxID=210007 RepID=Q8DT10_STRMU|nr:glycosyltransferase family 4 protein [Streptococcus mutans]AAN59231.1 putative hexosyltransferase [Streptococcus mutans UA159]AJD55849.1 hexosyltransferase [Streptococcus mutans UA159-FR]EMB58594.1 1,2-diacylglycerol 3-glucosyltransferase [Streptococcus mutans 8ID3]EMC61686.1 1,2-diacylglycerol 3-glucosyltransferase [Streptococcus mutans U2B]EMP59000.1 1,2-diacylglycerol 3-glucosyltransferase [Streptococcus mutans KK21]
MRVGLFTDTYLPQISGVATSIKTLKEELEKQGHEVYIFTTTDKHVKRYEDPTIIRLPSVPFISFTDRRIVYRGLFESYKIAKTYKLDIIHTQTEFSLGILGKMVGKALRIPVIHTYHTQYEDYVRYIANGKLIRPSMVKYIVRGFLNDLDGVICPSRIALNLLDGYSVKIPKRIIPTGIDLREYERPDISQEDIAKLREKWAIASDETVLLSLSRVSYEKNIQALLANMPKILSNNPKVKLLIVGDGPYLEELKEQAQDLAVMDNVIFTGMVSHNETALYYKAADFFISASTSETQGLTYAESLASGKPIIAQSNPYLDDLITDKMFGTLYQTESDLADAVLNAIVSTPAKQEKVWQKKLYEISAEAFGKSVFAFYLDMIISKKAKKKEKWSLAVEGNRADTSIRIVKSTIKLPATALKKTAKTSVKVIKAPVRMVNAIRDFLD